MSGSLVGSQNSTHIRIRLPRCLQRLWKPAVMHALTIFLTSNLYAGYPKPLHSFLRPGKLQWFPLCSLLFTSNICKWKYQEAIALWTCIHLPGVLRFDRRLLKHILPAWFRTTWLVFPTPLDACSWAVSGFLCICRAVVPFSQVSPTFVDRATAMFESSPTAK